MVTPTRFPKAKSLFNRKRDVFGKSAMKVEDARESIQAQITRPSRRVMATVIFVSSEVDRAWSLADACRPRDSQCAAHARNRRRGRCCLERGCNRNAARSRSYAGRKSWPPLGRCPVEQRLRVITYWIMALYCAAKTSAFVAAAPRQPGSLPCWTCRPEVRAAPRCLH